MLARCLEPAVPLHHRVLPLALAELGGWRKRDILGWFADYTKDLMEWIRDQVCSAAPINEPLCVAWLSHFLSAHAPGLRGSRATARAMHHVGLAHGRAMEVMQSLGPHIPHAWQGNMTTIAAPVDWVGINNIPAN